MKKMVTFAIIALLLLASIQISASPTASFEGKRVIILYKNEVGKQDIDELGTVGTKIMKTFKAINAVSAEVDENRIAQIESDEDVVAVFEDFRVFASLSGSVPQINADDVNLLGGSGIGVRVCIVDTGVDDTHPSLNALVAEYDFVNLDADAMDDNGHGTHVAGIVASKHSTYKGVAPGASLMAAKVLDAQGSGWTSDVIAGIDWCVANGADIISMSLGAGAYSGTCDTLPIAQASNTAVDQGVMVFAATGNNGYINSISAPACASKVIAVGAVDKNDGRTPYSNEGTGLDIVAPGTSITSTYLGGGFATLTGTSMATPHAAGTAALLLGKKPALTTAEVRSIMLGSAKDLGAAGFDTIYGYGRVDALAAWNAIAVGNQPPVANAGPDKTVSDADGTGSEAVILDGSTSYDPDGIITSYEWKEGNLTLGTTAVLASSFSIGTHTISLTVTDNNNSQSSDTAIVTVNANQPPIANAGADQTAMDSDGNGFETFLLNGSASSDPDGTIVSYEWQEGAAVLGNGAMIAFNFTVGIHNVTLRVTDDSGASSTDMATITVTAFANQPPVANAGPDKTASDADGTGSETVALDGSASYDTDGAIVSYEWKEGEVVLGTGAVISPVFAVGMHTVVLTITDNNGATASDTAIVTVNANQQPAANAGADKNAYTGQNVDFDGSASADPDGSIVSYSWDFGDSFSATGVTATHAYSSPGTYTATLTVTDNGGLMAGDFAIATINAQPTTIAVFSDDFQSGGFGKWTESNEFDWNVENPAERNIPSYPSSNLVAHADKCTSSKGCILTMKTGANLSGYLNATLKFWRYVDNDLDNGEFLQVQVLNGASWKTIFEWKNGSGDDDTWHYETYALPPAYLTGNFKARFVTKESSSSEDAEIDDVLIEGIR